ncbi:MAG: hypothetical protein QG658_484, partial [Patescibacteria group bacterium]|nr:hypothetical protein [Patescibacteria group bacterium]
LIDAEHVIENAKKHKNAADQIEFTDFVIINKVDVVEKDRITEIRQLVEMTNPRARIFEAVRANVDIRLLTDPDRVWDEVKAEKHDHQDGHNHEHFHDQFQHVSLTLDKPLHPMKFQEFVNSKIPKTVYRAKGFVDLGEKGHSRKYVFQLVGTRSELFWDNWRSGEDYKTQMVFIGTEFDSGKLEADFRECIDPDPQTPLEGIDLRLPQKWEG